MIVNRLRLYDYGASANCYKVRLLLAQLDQPYERIAVDIFAGETLSPDYAAINPARTTPVLELARGDHLPESNAILLFLAFGTPLLPDEPVARAHVFRWLLFEQADVMPTIGGLRFRLLTGRLSADEPEAVRRRQGAFATLQALDEHLRDRRFTVAEQYSIADIALYGYVHVAHEAGLDLAPYPAVGAWLETVAAQPGHVNDLEPYPPSAAAGASRSIYD